MALLSFVFYIFAIDNWKLIINQTFDCMVICSIHAAPP
jgi:hypothetical protein